MGWTAEMARELAMLVLDRDLCVHLVEVYGQ